MTIRYPFRFLGVLALAVLAAPSLFAQQRAYVPSDGFVYDGPAAERGAEVLRYYDPETDEQAITGAKPGGFVFGTNAYGDLGKAISFVPPSGEITISQVDIFLHRSLSPTLLTYDLVFYEGTAEAGPGDEIYRQSFEVEGIEFFTGDLKFGIEATEHVLDTPLTVEEAFFVGLVWDSSADPEDLGFVHTPTLPAEDPSPYEWEQFSDGSWVQMINPDISWGPPGWHAWLDVLYTAGTTAGEDDAQPQAVALAPIYPNPFTDRASVSVELDAAQRVSVEVFNVLGQRVATLFTGTLQGARTFVLDGASLGNGLYVVRMQGEDFVQSRKVVLSR